MDKKLIQKYANLIVECGANVQQGQMVTIEISIDQGEFAAMLVEECYKRGASDVEVIWDYQPLTKLTYKYQSEENLSKMPKWKVEKLKYKAEMLPARILILSNDPDGLAGIDKNKMQKVRQKTYKIRKKYIDMMENKHQWCIASVPGYKWAKKVFPTLSKNQAYEKLWQVILKASRVDKITDPKDNWKAHNENFLKRSKWLNEQKFESLEYKSSNGTDFKVGLIPEARWCGGGENTIQGTYFNPNIPTEEIFTTPMKGKAEGKLVSTKPLSYQGQIIEDFFIEFHEGKAVNWDAKKGKDLLTNMLTLDEGASYIGEVALVPVKSPISEMGILFYETLFDENASCHVAVGAGFNDTIENFENLTNEECQKLGVNDSMSHVDFMVGTDDLEIVGIKNGEKVTIFKNGNWAFDVK